MKGSQVLHKNGFEPVDMANCVFETKRTPIVAMSNLFQDEFGWSLDLYSLKPRRERPFQPFDVILTIKNKMEGGNIGLLRKNENEGEKYPCERCGYVDCVCTPYRTRNLPHRKD